MVSGRLHPLYISVNMNIVFDLQKKIKTYKASLLIASWGIWLANIARSFEDMYLSPFHYSPNQKLYFQVSNIIQNPCLKDISPMHLLKKLELRGT
jgi:hypothetical protein